MADRQAISRRNFLKRTAAAAVAFPAIIPASARGADGTVAPSNRITMGCIGLGGRGTVDMRAFLKQPDVQVLALCDVDQGSTNYEDHWHRGLAPAKEAVEKQYADQSPSGAYKGCATYNDFREVIARDDIDAVCIATPDHWHALIVVAAAKAGKHIYCEKPLSHSIRDGKAMVEAVKRYGVVFQCGSQRRSEEPWRAACEQLRNGRIGKIHTIKVTLMGPYWLRGSYRPQQPMPVPDGFDYDLWLGPAPWEPYTYNRCHWNFRWNLDYSGGNVTDWGAHFVDMAHWGMGTEDTSPVDIEGRGVFPDRGELWNAATEFHFVCTYANGMKLHVDSGGGGVRWEGTDGYAENTDVHPKSGAQPVSGNEVRLYVSNDHHRNFVDCVKSRERTAAPVDVAHRSIAVAHLGNIAMLTGRKIKYDPAKEEIIGDAGASALLGRAYREPWVL